MITSKITSINNIYADNLENNTVQNGINKNISFKEYIKAALNNVNQLIIESDQITEDFITGKTDNIHQVMIAAEKADIALQLTMQVRNKILDAYNEIMRMQI